VFEDVERRFGLLRAGVRGDEPDLAGAVPSRSVTPRAACAAPTGAVVRGRVQFVRERRLHSTLPFASVTTSESRSTCQSAGRRIALPGDEERCQAASQPEPDRRDRCRDDRDADRMSSRVSKKGRPSALRRQVPLVGARARSRRARPCRTERALMPGRFQPRVDLRGAAKRSRASRARSAGPAGRSPFPALDRPHAAAEVRGNLLPAVQLNRAGRAVGLADR